MRCTICNIEKAYFIWPISIAVWNKLSQGKSTLRPFRSLVDLNCFLRWAMWPMSLLFYLIFIKTTMKYKQRKLSNIFSISWATKILMFYCAGNCPVFTSDGFLDWKPCNISEASCPNSSYVSNEVYKCKTFSVFINSQNNEFCSKNVHVRCT